MKTLFKIDDYGSPLAASIEAGRIARMFSHPWRMRYPAPPIWTKYDADKGGYVLEPNLDYHPNRAWQDLQDALVK